MVAATTSSSLGKDSPARVAASGRYYFMPPSKAVREEQDDLTRAIRVRDMAKERGNFAMSIQDVACAWNAITAGEAKHLKGDDYYRLDLYAVTIRGQPHTFLWCRDRTRILSYVGHGHISNI